MNDCENKFLNPLRGLEEVSVGTNKRCFVILEEIILMINSGNVIIKYIELCLIEVCSETTTH